MKRKISVIISTILALSIILGQFPVHNLTSYASEPLFFDEDDTSSESIEISDYDSDSDVLLIEETSEQKDEDNESSLDIEDIIINEEEDETEFSEFLESDTNEQEVPDLFTDVVIEVNEHNFANYFEKGADDLAYFKEGVSPDKIVFNDDIDGSDCLGGIKGICLDKKIEITAEESTELSGIYMDVRADDVTINEVTISNTGKYAICVNNANNISIINASLTVETLENAEGYAIYAYNSDNLSIDDCGIVFKGHTDGKGTNAAVYVSGDSIVNGLKFINNTVYASMPSCYVPWVEQPIDSGNWVGIPVTYGLCFDNCSNSDITKNFVVVTATDIIGGYDTLYGMFINGTNNSTKEENRDADIIIKENTIKSVGKSYTYGVSIAYCDYILSDNIIFASSDNYLATAVDVNYSKTGVIARNIIDVSYTDGKDVKTDDGCTYGIYNYCFDTQSYDVTITDNVITATSYASFGISNRIKQSEGNRSTISRNIINGTGQYITGIASYSLKNLYIADNAILANGGNTGNITIWEEFGIATRGILVVDTGESDCNANVLRNLITSTDSGIICETNSYMANNGVTAGSDYAIDVVGSASGKEYYSSVFYNVLFAKESRGDDAVYYRNTDDVESNIGYPETTTIEAGQSLSDSFISDGFNGAIGTFSWSNPYIVPSASDDGKTEYDVIFVPANTEIAESITTKAIVRLSKVFYVDGLYDRVYTGSKITFDDLKVYSSDILLEKGKDYTLSYTNNINAGTAHLIVKGKGNYYDQQTVDFKILPADISSEEFEADDFYLIDNGKNQKKSPVLKRNGKTIPSSNYSIKYCEEGTTATTENPKEVTNFAKSYVVLITANKNKNYVGTRAVNVSISKDVILISKTTISLNEKTGNYPISKYGNDVRPVVTVQKGDTIFENGIDYSVSFYNNTAPGKGYLIVKGKGDKLYGQKKISFNIIGISLKTATVEGVNDKNFSYNYSDGVIQSAYVVKCEEDILTEGKDFEVEYRNNKKPGTASITFKGIGNYTGNKKVNFKINKGIINKVSLEDYNVEYAKGGAKPEIIVSSDNYPLTEGIDYTVKYSGNTVITDGNTAKATIKGKGYFSNTNPVDIYFAVIQKTVIDGDGSFELTAADKNLASGKVSKVSKLLQIPKIKDSATGKALKKSTDYDPEINYYIGVDRDEMIYISSDDKKKDFGAYFKELFPDSNYEESGVYIKAEYKLAGYFTGSYSTIYRVADSKISSAKADIISVTYTGNAFEFDSKSPTFATDFVIYVGKNKSSGTILEYGTDYKIVDGSYKDNIKKGKATVTIIGLGKYSGTKNVSFKIVSKKI